MPIQMTKYGQQEPVLFLEFGSGDIMFTQAMHEGGAIDLIFSQHFPKELPAEESNEFVGKPSDEIPDIKMVMQFTRPESIAALIHSLSEVQKQVFINNKQPKPTQP